MYSMFDEVNNVFAVVGSRNITDFELLASILKKFKIEKIISGGAKGVDNLAARYARENNIPLQEIKPDYNQYGRIAPLIRNKEIIKQADQVIVLWDGKSTGTVNAMNHAKKLNKPVHLYKIN